MPRILALVLLALAASCSGGPAARREFVSGIERRVLSNGLAVVALEDPRLPTITAMLSYAVGSVNEPPGLTGVSHYFEHMVFKGTKKYPPGSIDRITQRCGGENNAYTTHDMTGYWFHVHASHLDEVLDILADTMGNCSLDAAEFERERGPVLQEMAIWLDGPWGPLERDLEKTVYERSRYRHPVLGWKEDVEKLTRERMLAYYRAHYSPNNASLVVVGNLPKEEIFRKAERYFAGLPAGTSIVPPEWREAPQGKERKVELQTDLPSDRFILAYRTAAAGSDTDLVLDVAATVLGDGRTSRLVSRLADDEDLASQQSIEVFNYSRKHEGVFYIKTELALDANAEQARAIVLEELERLSEELVREHELRRAKNILRARFAFESESQYELASKIGYFEALGQPDYVSSYMDRIEAITAEQIRAVARNTFQPALRTWAIGKAKAPRAGKGGAPGKRKSGRRPPWSLLRPGIQATYAPPQLGDVRERTLPNGLRLLALRRAGVPVLSVQALVNAGQVYEPEDQAGVAQLTGDLLDEGIEDDRGRRRGAEEIAGEIEFVGGQFSCGAAGVAAKVLSEHAAAGFDLIRDLLRFPSFPRPRFEALKSDLLAEIESRDDDPSRVARRLFYEEAYRGHPYQRPASGSAESVGALTLKQVREYHRRLFRPENTIVAVVGDLDPEAAFGELQARLGGWEGEGASPGLPVAPAAKRGTESRTIYRSYKSQQARIHLGHVGVDRRTPDWAALRVMETILCSSSGFTNRLAQRVREQDGLAYDVGGTITGGAGVSAGPFEIVLGVEAKDKDRAVALVREELKRFLAEGPTEDEVRDARRYLLASYSSAWETSDSVAAWLLEVKRHGLGLDYAARFHREVSAVTRGEVVRVARQWIDLGALTTVVVGPVDKNGKLLEGAQDQ